MRHSHVMRVPFYFQHMYATTSKSHAAVLSAAGGAVSEITRIKTHRSYLQEMFLYFTCHSAITLIVILVCGSLVGTGTHTAAMRRSILSIYMNTRIFVTIYMVLCGSLVGTGTRSPTNVR